MNASEHSFTAAGSSVKSQSVLKVATATVLHLREQRCATSERKSAQAAGWRVR